MSSLGGRHLAALSELACLVADGTATRRSQLAQATGLSRAAVAQRVDLLVARGLLVETEPVATERGRPPLALQLAPDALICAVDLGATHCRLALSTLGGLPLVESVREIDINEGPQHILTGVRELTTELLAQIDRPQAHLRAFCIGVPGPVEHETGTVIRPPIMQGWDGYRIPDFFGAQSLSGEHYDPGVTVLVDNDVNMMAFGEYSRRRDTKHLLFIKVGTGIGCGIISNGTLHRGAAGAAGDIGHIPLPGHEDVLCHCGNTGCVEAVASGAAIARALREAGLPATGGRDVVRLVSEGNPVARRRVRLAGQQIGEVLASLVSFHNPDAIVIGGSIAQLHEDLLADIRGVVYRRALPLATRTLAIETSSLGERAGVEGAARMAARHLLSPEGIERLLVQPVR
ncbi:MAG TPA: ROK family transcriptional regulator [Actinocrinis sp.]|uniref:ROK family transcriptional regulator n=1 Tax=Actinocrinis sp. TaxID=1920516 RepID=UPI002D49FC41|nr:ROK family transcriptional regulator [Actinocrinis sp.]HZU54535.1 ROK family transcriptional regulator [Actinocrinis sp.]